MNGRPVNDALEDEAPQKPLKILYFARVAELVGRREEVWPWDDPAAEPLTQPLTCGRWQHLLLKRHPQLAPLKRLKIAVNQQYVRDDVVIAPGDEVAVFEPVTGG